VTIARAAEASRHDNGNPDTGEPIEPDTSSASRIRSFAGSTAP
jgi:hypothetical protein